VSQVARISFNAFSLDNSQEGWQLSWELCLYRPMSQWLTAQPSRNKAQWL